MQVGYTSWYNDYTNKNYWLVVVSMINQQVEGMAGQRRYKGTSWYNDGPQLVYDTWVQVSTNPIEYTRYRNFD